MHWKPLFVGGLAVGLAAVPVTAQTVGQEPTAAQRPAQQDEQVSREVIRADRLIGQVVRDRQDERSGRIHDLALDVSGERIAYVVVNRGGLWGVGGETVALPWEQVRPDQAARVVRIESQQLQQARAIDTSRAWPETLGGDEPVGTAGAEEGRRGTVPLSNVLDMDVQNRQDERIGRIHDVAIARDGSVEYAVIAHGGFLGVGDRYVAVPWDRVTLDTEREHVVLDVRQEQLENAPRFDENQSWPASVDWPFGGSR